MHSPSLEVKPEDSHGQQAVPILTRIKTEVIKHEKIQIHVECLNIFINCLQIWDIFEH